MTDFDPKDELQEEFARYYMKWLRYNGNPLDEPTSMDYPELSEEQVDAAREEARKRFGSVFVVAPRIGYVYCLGRW